MKNSILILLLALLPALMYSQTYTEKYNSLYERYELYDSSGQMVSYKKYNSLYDRWEIYEVNSLPSTYQGLKPVDPTNWDAAYKVLAYKQQQYDSGKLYVDNQISKLSQSITNSTTLSEDEKIKLRNSITNDINEINSKGNSDFSDVNVVNNIVNYIYQGYNNTIKQINDDRKKKQEKVNKTNTSTTSVSKYSDRMKENFNVILDVKSIYVYDKNGKYLRTEAIKDKSFILLKEGEIRFKRADGTDGYRNLIFTEKEGVIYRYSSNWGNVEIRDKFEYVKFYDPNTGECYWYSISKYTL